MGEVKGDFAGATVKFILEDDQAKPPTGVLKAEKLIRQDQVHMLVGGGWSSSQPSHPFGEWACAQGYKKIAAVAADYAFGYEVVGGFQKTFEECGGKIIQKI